MLAGPCDQRVCCLVHWRSIGYLALVFNGLSCTGVSMGCLALVVNGLSC